MNGWISMNVSAAFEAGQAVLRGVTRPPSDGIGRFNSNGDDHISWKSTQERLVQPRINKKNGVC